jgi:hypothetical protein
VNWDRSFVRNLKSTFRNVTIAAWSAAFNAPLSGLVFVLEEVQRDFHPVVFGTAFLAAAVADVVARFGADPFPVFSVTKYPTPPLATLPAFAILGIVAGLLGVAFNRGLVVLILEMTGNYEQMLPLLISCFFAYAVAEFLKDLPIYEVLLERDLLSGGEHTDLTQPIVMDFTIQEGAPFEGQLVRSLGLPSGCILVRCSNGRREWVPEANTRLEANMRITAVIEPDAAAGLAILRHGCESSDKKKNVGKPKSRDTN